MAINIRFGTTFDDKGLRALNKELGYLSTSVSSLGRNFAIAGSAVVGAGALLGKAVMSASNYEAEFEGVNQVFKEAAGSVQAFAEQASKSAGLSATEALRASKTFGLFATGAGLGVEEAAKFSTTMVQLAGDLGSFNDVPTEEALQAIQSGLMGQSEPLRKFGVFLDDITLKNELFKMTGQEVTGTLDTQQKMVAAYSAILSQTTVQQGDYIKYQETLGNQLKTISTDFQNLARDIGVMLIPVITEAMPVIKEMATEIGEKLKGAIGSIDWKSLIQSVLDFTVFLVTNAQTIATTIGVVFALNTAYKFMAVASGLVSAAVAIQTYVTGQLAAGMTIATIATNIFSTALRLIPFVAIATGVALIVTGIIQLGDETKKNQPYVDSYGGAIRKTGDDATWAAGRYGVAADEAARLATNTAAAFKVTSASYDRYEVTRAKNMAEASKAAAAKVTPTMPDFSSLLAGLNSGGSRGGGGKSRAQQAAEEAQRQEQELLNKRQRSFESFNESVKSLFGQIKDSILSSFNLPSLGNSVNSITRNISKLLESTKAFASNITKLSGLGLNSALLQQVIQAGPMAGSQLANALVSGGASFIDQLNTSYGEFGNLAGGIAGVGTGSAFGNAQTVNNYSIEVTGGVATSSDVGRAVVNAIKDFERQSGTAWRG
jgi:hypothetical protein